MEALRRGSGGGRRSTIGMVVGLGTGSTAAFFGEAFARRIAGEGLHISGIPTSDHTSEHARSLRIPLTTFAEHTQIDRHRRWRGS